MIVTVGREAIVKGGLGPIDRKTTVSILLLMWYQYTEPNADVQRTVVVGQRRIW